MILVDKTVDAFIEELRTLYGPRHVDFIHKNNHVWIYIRGETNSKYYNDKGAAVCQIILDLEHKTVEHRMALPLEGAMVCRLLTEGFSRK